MIPKHGSPRNLSLNNLGRKLGQYGPRIPARLLPIQLVSTEYNQVRPLSVEGSSEEGLGGVVAVAGFERGVETVSVGGGVV